MGVLRLFATLGWGHGGIGVGVLQSGIINEMKSRANFLLFTECEILHIF